ncbi:MAG: BACON domain-containing carbohydrate-binding protein, partial [Bacteroidales bacterium]|nr:BACON domain-containing carbohydrate-binding protein [Bacteroidales bacterium]
MKKLFFIMASFVLATCGCNGGNGPEPSDDPQIEISETELDFGYASESRSLTVTSNCEWGVTSGQSWCTTFPTGGLEGTTTLTVNAAENRSGEDRTCVLIFQSGSYKKELSLLQHLNPADTVTIVDPGVAVPNGYKLVWRDEFERLDPSEWWFETGAGGWGNNEIQRYIPGYEEQDTCAVVSEGILKIIA